MRELLGKQKQICVPSILTSSPLIQIKLKVTVLLKLIKFHVHVSSINLVPINRFILSHSFMCQLSVHQICTSLVCLACQSWDQVSVLYVQFRFYCLVSHLSKFSFEDECSQGGDIVIPRMFLSKEVNKYSYVWNLLSCDSYLSTWLTMNILVIG